MTKIQLSDHFTYPRLLRFVFPSIVMMVFTSIYGVVDGLFVSNFVGKAAFASVNLITPFLMLLGGVGFMLGTGGSALVAKTLGERRPEQANRYFTMVLMVTLIAGAVLSVLGVLVMRPVALFLGAGENMVEDCVLYGRITLMFAWSFMLQNLFQSFLVTAEKPKLGLAVTVAAGVTNMVLDAVMVGALRWGVAGAAIATGLSQCVGGVLPLVYFLRPNSSLLRLTRTRIEGRPILWTCSNGISEMVSNVTASVVGMLYNFQLLKYAGQDGVAAYGVLMYVQFIFAAVFIGYAIGCAPIVGYHFGAANYSELRSLRQKSLRLMAGSGCGMVVVTQLLASPLGRIFVGYDAGLFDMTVRAFRICSVGFLFAGINIFSSSFFTALSNGGVSAAISFLRTFVFKLSAVLILPLILKLDGVWFSDVTAEALACVVSVVFLVVMRKKYNY